MRLYSLLLLLVAACSDQAAEVNASATDTAPATSPADLIWDAPVFPEGASMSIDGEAVPTWILYEFLNDEWTQFAARHAVQPDQVDESVPEFLVQPGVLFAPLVRDWLLLREHKERHSDEIDEHDFEHWASQVGPQAGAAAEQIEARLGSERWREHLENQYRVRKIMLEFQAAIGQITEADIEAEFAFRQQRLRDSGEYNVEELANMPGLDEGNLREAIEAQLAAEMAERGIDEWLGELLPVTVVEFTDPSGKTRVLDVPVQSRG